MKTWIGNLCHTENKCDLNPHRTPLGVFYRYEVQCNSWRLQGNHRKDISFYCEPCCALSNFVSYLFCNRRYHKQSFFLCLLPVYEHWIYGQSNLIRDIDNWSNKFVRRPWTKKLLSNFHYFIQKHKLVKKKSQKNLVKFS